MGNTCNQCLGKESELDNFKDGLDRAMHPNETAGERFVRKAGDAINDAKDEIVDGATKVKDKIADQF